MRLFGSVGLVFITLTTFISAQPPPAGKEPITPSKVPSHSQIQPVEVRFNDGSIMKLTLLDGTLEVPTKYGKLVVPIEDIRKIDLALRYPDGLPQKIEAAIVQLGDKDYRKREAANTELLQLRQFAYPAVQRASHSSDAEIANRAGKIMEELERRLPDEDLNIKPYDVIHTVEFSIAGRLELTVLRAYSPYLGEVEVKLTDARTIRFPGAGDE